MASGGGGGGGKPPEAVGPSSSSSVGGATASSVVPSFHPRSGQLVSFSNGHRCASRTHAAQEFNHGLVLSSQPLQDNQIFEVRTLN
jgi:neuralized-like protein 4